MREPLRMTEALDAAHVLIGVIGWATVGLALSSLYPFTLVVLFGLAGAAVTARSWRIGVALEGLTIAFAIALVGEGAYGALALGLFIVTFGVALGLWSARRKAAGL
jgi:hypothetical protein